MRNLIFFLAIALTAVACQQNKSLKDYDVTDAIRINQLGFYPESTKQFILADSIGTSFELINEEGKVIFTGKFADQGFWIMSGEKVRLGDFTSVKETGTYRILVDNKLKSYSFEIKTNLYEEALTAAIKGYYFQRASIPIEEKYGGIYKRVAGHPDNDCQYHPSTGRSSGSLNSPGGWYDAGDYGKYVVNASFSVGQLLNLLEQYPDVIKDGTLNIPESGNGISDLWDEVKYELDWLLTMQEADGGVYHKLTAKTFSGFIMPSDYTLKRWIIGKGTAATLDFAAVMAQASRLYKNIDDKWAVRALRASQMAWNWAVVNDSIPFSNPEDIVTGAYDDVEFKDNFYWAAAELYITTKNEIYLSALYTLQQPYVHKLTNSWKFFVRNNGFHSLLANKEMLDTTYAKALVEGHLILADEILSVIDSNPYKIALNTYEWGSNSDILNQALILCVAHKLTGEEKYLVGAEQINDYIYGKNATGYCFLTGFGSKKVMNVHHRPSGADGIVDPVPGFIAGGPNNDRQDQSTVDYISLFPAKAYADVEESYASNEVCINWNSPAVYVMGYLEQVRN